MLKCLSHLIKNDWNLHYIRYAQNELVLTIHEGESTTSSTHIKVPMQPSDDPCKIFELATTQSSNCDIAVDKLYKAIIKLNHKIHQVIMSMLVLFRVLIQGYKSLILATIRNTTSSY